MGNRARGYTFQGHADESLWSRGQAWAIYGYSATTAATRNKAYLDVAEAVSQRYLERLGDHPVPFWDFNDPAIPDAPRDSSAAAIVAAGFLAMAGLHPDPEKGAAWRGHAFTMLECLCTDYLARMRTGTGACSSTAVIRSRTGTASTAPCSSATTSSSRR